MPRTGPLVYLDASLPDCRTVTLFSSNIHIAGPSSQGSRIRAKVIRTNWFLALVSHCFSYLLCTMHLRTYWVPWVAFHCFFLLLSLLRAIQIRTCRVAGLISLCSSFFFSFSQLEMDLATSLVRDYLSRKLLHFWKYLDRRRFMYKLRNEEQRETSSNGNIIREL